jgi:exodeoxyribonuclease-3
MKIISWNVNGFRAAVKNGFMDWLAAANPDVLSLQEVRVEWSEIEPRITKTLEEEYEVCWFPCSIKKGYSGSATLTRKGLGFSHQKGLGIEAYDQEGRMIISQLKTGNGEQAAATTLIAGYFPNASEKLARLPFKRAFSKDLATIVKERHQKGERVIVVGDMNVAPEEIDLAHPETNRKTAGFTNEEREDFRGYLASGLRDVFREQNPDVKGLYTWWSARTGARAKGMGWRIDIFLVSDALLPLVKSAKIHPEVFGSDHCPVSLEIDL